MPYELSFTKHVQVIDRARYINSCSVAGDVVSAALLPALQARYGRFDTGEEDWGWFMWSTSDGLRLSVDVFTDDDLAGKFRARVATSRRRRLLGWKEIDTAALDELRGVVQAQLTAWLGQPPLVVHVD